MLLTRAGDLDLWPLLGLAVHSRRSHPAGHVAASSAPSVHALLDLGYGYHLRSAAVTGRRNANSTDGLQWDSLRDTLQAQSSTSVHAAQVLDPPLVSLPLQPGQLFPSLHGA